MLIGTTSRWLAVLHRYLSKCYCLVDSSVTMYIVYSDSSVTTYVYWETMLETHTTVVIYS